MKFLIMNTAVDAMQIIEGESQRNLKSFLKATHSIPVKCVLYTAKHHRSSRIVSQYLSLQYNMTAVIPFMAGYHAGAE